MNEETTKRSKKSPAPVKFYGLVQLKNTDDGSYHTSEIVADSKAELFKALESFPVESDMKVLMLIRGRKINLQQKVSFKI